MRGGERPSSQKYERLAKVSLAVAISPLSLNATVPAPKTRALPKATLAHRLLGAALVTVPNTHLV
jgi:hypothetical protein